MVIKLLRTSALQHVKTLLRKFKGVWIARGIMAEHSIRWEKQCAKATYNELYACYWGECINDPDNIREAASEAL